MDWIETNLRQWVDAVTLEILNIFDEKNTTMFFELGFKRVIVVALMFFVGAMFFVSKL